jgi:hypothetical protein
LDGITDRPLSLWERVRVRAFSAFNPNPLTLTLPQGGRGLETLHRLCNAPSGLDIIATVFPRLTPGVIDIMSLRDSNPKSKITALKQHL